MVASRLRNAEKQLQLITANTTVTKEALIKSAEKDDYVRARYG